MFPHFEAWKKGVAKTSYGCQTISVKYQSVSQNPTFICAINVDLTLPRFELGATETVVQALTDYSSIHYTPPRHSTGCTKSPYAPYEAIYLKKVKNF
jgi:hypothetical protein